MPSIIAVIPSKTTSNRIAGKNLRVMCGKPLYQHARDTCYEAGIFDRIYVSSDKVLDMGRVGQSRGSLQIAMAYFHARHMPMDGNAPASDVAVEVLNDFYVDQAQMPEWTCLVQPTSPCLRAETLRAAAKICNENTDAVIAHRVSEAGKACGAFYFVRSYLLIEKGAFANLLRASVDYKRCEWYVIPSSEAIDVDCHCDWDLAEVVLKRRARE